MAIQAAYNDVRAFHLAFNHPAPTEAVLQPFDRAKKRANWLDEEAGELREAGQLDAQADACLDGLYFNLGGLVECGAEHEVYQLIYPTWKIRPHSMSNERAMVYAKAMEGAATELREAIDREEQVDAYLFGLDLNMDALAELGVNWKPLFDIVHGANMSKLHDIDGVKAPVYHPDGKVKKPEGWQAPEPQLQAEIARQIDAAT
jgi:hypothetical protein